MKLYDYRGGVAAAGSFSPPDYMVLPEHKKVFIDLITVELETKTSGKASVSIISGGDDIPIAQGIPFDASDSCLAIFANIHLEAGMGLRAVVENAGAATMGRFSVFGVK